MTAQLSLSIGQFSDKGRKDTNQDFHGVCVPDSPALATKGVAIALADGISSSDVSQRASQTAVRSFLEDYYCTSESWSVQTSASKVLNATNSWLFSQNQRQLEYRINKDKGFVCTFSAIIFKSTTAYLFHIGDARIFKIVNDSTSQRLEQLTHDHRVWLSKDKSYLGRALGVTQKLEIDHGELPVEQGDTFIISSDGVHDHIDESCMIKLISEQSDDLDSAARNIVNTALNNGSDDNLTVQIIRVDQLPDQNSSELLKQAPQLPFAPNLEARMVFDGYDIIRELYASSRSHVLLARDQATNTKVVLKVPSVDCRDDNAYLDRFLMEDWIAKRLNNAHILKAATTERKRNFLYIATEYIEGQTLMQWMIDNPNPSIDKVRNIIEQVAKGLQAFHRQEMLHQDLRPHNIMIDQQGTVKIIDFGSTYVAGINEMDSPFERQHILGTVQFTAPEYFLGEPGTRHSDLYSLACICYQMLCGRLPYGTAAAKANSKVAQRRLIYQSVLDDKSEIPAWVDHALKRALNPNPLKRQSELSEFIYELKQPSSQFLASGKPPLVERNPVLFWKITSLILSISLIYILAQT